MRWEHERETWALWCHDPSSGRAVHVAGRAFADGRWYTTARYGGEIGQAPTLVDAKAAVEAAAWASLAEGLAER